MAITASTILTRVRNQLIDNLPTKRWTDVELLNWLTDGARTIVVIDPNSASTIAVLPLKVGTMQSLPADGHSLLTIFRNTSSDGKSPGRAVHVVRRELLDTHNPNWHTATPAKVAQNFIYDTDEQTVFFVYPPNDGTGFVEASYAQLPVELTAVTDTLNLREAYQTALFDYVMFRAHQKDSDFAAGQQIAAGYMQLFLAAMQKGAETDLTQSPNATLAGFNPGTTGGAK